MKKRRKNVERYRFETIETSLSFHQKFNFLHFETFLFYCDIDFERNNLLRIIYSIRF